MTSVRSITRLPPAERRLVVAVGLRLVAVRLGLWLLPVRMVRGVIARAASAPCSTRLDAAELDRISWAVKAASRRVPRATCLVQALATSWLLDGLGERAELRIGVAKRGDDAVEAHAWVECQGRVVAGKVSRMSRYHVLRPLKG